MSEKRETNLSFRMSDIRAGVLEGIIQAPDEQLVPLIQQYAVGLSDRISKLLQQMEPQHVREIVERILETALAQGGGQYFVDRESYDPPRTEMLKIR